MKTIFDFKKAGEKLKRNWKKPYLLVGCPFRETARAILWAVGVRSKGLSDGLSLAGIPALGIAAIWLPLKVHGLIGWPPWPLIVGIGLECLIVFLGYGPLDGYGERLHGDPFKPGDEGDVGGDLAKEKK